MSSKWEFSPFFEGYILIEPRAKARPRFFRGKVYTPKETRQYETALRMALKKQWADVPVPKDIPVGVSVVFHFTKPKSVKRDYPTVKPDLDNAQKALLDAMNGVVLHDDCQVVRIDAQKCYSSTTGFIELKLYRLDELRSKL